MTWISWKFVFERSPAGNRRQFLVLHVCFFCPRFGSFSVDLGVSLPGLVGRCDSYLLWHIQAENSLQHTKTTWPTCKRWVCASARTDSPPLGLGAALCAVKAAQGILPLQAPCVLYGKPEIRVA